MSSDKPDLEALRNLGYRKPQPGETLHCWVSHPNYMSHQHMLFLGPDKVQKDNLLVQSKEFGWNIISLSLIPDDGYRVTGRPNIIEEFKEQGQVIGYVYRFFDNREKIDLQVKLIDGIWKIKKFSKPSWMEKK